MCYSLFNNLLKNAMEAAAGDTAIHIDISAQDDQIKVRLTNDGVVPSDLRAIFFDKFSTSGKPKGSGLGTFLPAFLPRHKAVTLTWKPQMRGTTPPCRCVCPAQRTPERFITRQAHGRSKQGEPIETRLKRG